MMTNDSCISTQKEWEQICMKEKTQQNYAIKILEYGWLHSDYLNYKLEKYILIW